MTHRQYHGPPPGPPDQPAPRQPWPPSARLSYDQLVQERDEWADLYVDAVLDARTYREIAQAALARVADQQAALRRAGQTIDRAFTELRALRAARGTTTRAA